MYGDMFQSFFYMMKRFGIRQKDLPNYIREIRSGWRRIRTFEGIASRFTVCPLWPLGNLPIKADERTRTVNLLITNQLLCQLSHIGVLNLIACRSKTLFSRSRCNRLYDENINLTLMQAFVRLMFPSCTQSLFREN